MSIPADGLGWDPVSLWRISPSCWQHGNHDRRLLDLAAPLPPGASEVTVFNLWLERSPLHPRDSRLLSMPPAKQMRPDPGARPDYIAAFRELVNRIGASLAGLPKRAPPVHMYVAGSAALTCTQRTTISTEAVNLNQCSLNSACVGTRQAAHQLFSLEARVAHPPSHTCLNSRPRRCDASHKSTNPSWTNVGLTLRPP
jgi:hypothetical protein